MKHQTLTIAAAITKAASTQTYYTIRFLVDRDRVEDAFRAYAYFRWVDDALDAGPGAPAMPGKVQAQDRRTFFERQQTLLEDCYRGRVPTGLDAHENMLVELVGRDREKNSGLQIYLRNMMKVMAFDSGRRGRLISQAELDDYTRWLATAVTECIHHFIGHGGFAPRDETRYLAVSAAHIVHMLRDTFDDARLGYHNIPRETLEAGCIDPLDVNNDAYRAWVRRRLLLAREYFEAGKAYFARVQSARCRLACFAYIARFEWLSDIMEKEGCRLRPEYRERKSAGTGLRMVWLTLSSVLSRRTPDRLPQPAFLPRRAGSERRRI